MNTNYQPVIPLALALDWIAGEPPNPIHPVVWIGNLATRIARHAPHGAPRRELLYGAGMTALCVGATTLPVFFIERTLCKHNAIARLLLFATLLKTTFAWRALVQASARVARALEANDLATARVAVRSLVSRDTTTLDESLIVAATIESLAENACDSVVAPLCAYHFAGLPGAFAYRTINTLDAMFGYRNHYEYLGKVPARVDDLLNLLPARLTALLIVLAASLCGNDAPQAWRVMWHDHRATPSPNGGWTMSAVAGGLGVRLEKEGCYALNESGRVPTVTDIRRAEWLIGVALLFGAVAFALSEQKETT